MAKEVEVEGNVAFIEILSTTKDWENLESKQIELIDVQEYAGSGRLIKIVTHEVNPDKNKNEESSYHSYEPIEAKGKL